jgi:hypothetical protein
MSRGTVSQTHPTAPAQLNAVITVEFGSVTEKRQQPYRDLPLRERLTSDAHE